MWVFMAPGSKRSKIFNFILKINLMTRTVGLVVSENIGHDASLRGKE